MRVIIVVIDSFGIGALPDAGSFGDEGAATAAHIAAALGREEGALWPNLRILGLGNAAEIAGEPLRGCEAVERPEASFGVMAELSQGKDTTTGHWELAGVVLEEPFRTFDPEYPSFPEELIAEFSERTGRSVLGNCAASGTVIIQELGDEHVSTGKPIVYTSSDSVFQIAAHEEVIPLEELYRICEIARELCDPYRIGRVIARPFVGATGEYTRTPGRRDFSMEPTGETIFDLLNAAGVETVAIGKIGDIFAERGIAVSHHDKGNPACLDRLERVLAAPSASDQLIFVNLVDTDMIYGHRRDPAGYAQAVTAIDDRIPAIRGAMAADDVLVFTADHGCDPTFRGTDHTREYVPILWCEPARSAESLGVRSTFADLAATVAACFCESTRHGTPLFVGPMG